MELRPRHQFVAIPNGRKTRLSKNLIKHLKLSRQVFWCYHSCQPHPRLFPALAIGSSLRLRDRTFYGGASPLIAACFDERLSGGELNLFWGRFLDVFRASPSLASRQCVLEVSLTPLGIGLIRACRNLEQELGYNDSAHDELWMYSLIRRASDQRAEASLHQFEPLD